MRHSPRISYQEPSLPAVSSGALAEFKLGVGGASPGAVTVPLDRAFVPFIARQGKVAIGAGTANCEIRDISSISGVTLTLNTGLFNTHTADERVVFFEGTLVPASWWGVKGNDSTIDSRVEMQAALRAVGKSQSAAGSPLFLDGQMKDIYLSGPVAVVTSTGIANFRLRAKNTGTGYLAPKDGPDHPTYETNALCLLGLAVHRFTYSQATNTFTAINASGAATSHGMGVGSRIVFDVGNLPTGLVAGRVYRTVVHPSTSTFQIAHLETDPALTFGTDGDGWVTVGLEDNCKLYARKITIDGQNVGRVSVTAAAATDLFTATAHGFVDGDQVRFNLNGTLPGGVQAGEAVYYVRDSTANTFKIAATAGGAAIDITSDGAAWAINPRAALNGAIWGMQQPSFCDHIRFDDCTGFGVRVQAQQSTWFNLECLGCGTSVELGGEESTQSALFAWFYGLDTEQCDVRDVLVRAAKCVNVYSQHVEETGTDPKVVWDVRAAVQQLRIQGIWITAGSSKTLFRFESGIVNKTDYEVENLRGTFPSSAGQCIAIDDRDRGIYLDMVTDFGGQGIARYSTFATDTPSASDPHPYRWDGLDGTMVGWGSANIANPFAILRHGARHTGDIAQLKTWTALTGTITLDLGTDTFTTSVAHGLTEGQVIHINTGSSVTVNGPAKWVNSAIYRARNVTATTFQVSHTPTSPLLDFATGPATNWTISYVGTLRQRLNKDARLVTAHNTAPADADLGNGEAAWWWDATLGAAVFKGKKSDGTPVSVTPVDRNLLTTKGDLLGRDASGVARLGVGANGQILTADDTASLGWKWANAAGGGGGLNYSPPYRQIARQSGRATVAAAAGTSYVLVGPAQNDQSSFGASSTTPLIPFYLDDADFTVAGATAMLRVRAVVLSGNVALTNNVTVSLRPATLAGGNISAGALVTGSDVTLTTPAANTANHGESADFAVPADGLYLLGYTVSATPNGAFVIHAELQLHYV